MAAASLLVLSAGLGVPAEPFRLAMPVVYGTHLPGLAELAAQLAKLVDQLSGGTLKLDLKQPGDGTQPHEILDKVSHGSVDAGFSIASFWGAKIPAAALFAGFPFGPDAKGYVDWFFAGNGRTLYQEMYDDARQNVHVIPCAFGVVRIETWSNEMMEAFHSAWDDVAKEGDRDPVFKRVLDDLEKFRAPKPAVSPSASSAP